MYTECYVFALIWQRLKAHKCASGWGWRASSDGPGLYEPCQDWGKGTESMKSLKGFTDDFISIDTIGQTLKPKLV